MNITYTEQDQAGQLMVQQQQQRVLQMGNQHTLGGPGGGLGGSGVLHQSSLQSLRDDGDDDAPLHGLRGLGGGSGGGIDEPLHLGGGGGGGQRVEMVGNVRNSVMGIHDNGLLNDNGMDGINGVASDDGANGGSLAGGHGSQRQRKREKQRARKEKLRAQQRQQQQQKDPVN